MNLWKKKSLSHLQERAEEKERLKKDLTSSQLISMGVGSIIGAGIFSITGVAAAENAGPAIILSFLIAAIGCLATSFCYSELAALIPTSGSAYTYSYVIFGEFVGWIIGWSLILEYAIGTATVAVSWSAYVASFLYDMGIELPREWTVSSFQKLTYSSGEEISGIINLPALFIVALLSLVLIRGIKESATLNSFMVMLKVGVIALFVAIGFFYINWSNYEPFIPQNQGSFGSFGVSGIFRAAGIVFFAYIGFDAVSTLAQETKNPAVAMPIGIIGSLVICTLLYLLFASVLVGVVNYQEINIAAPAISAVDYMPYPWLKGLIKLAILLGLSSVILVLLVGQSRILYAMSQDGFIPACFSKTTREQTPWVASLASLLFVGGIAAYVPIDVLGNLTSIGTLFAFSIVCLGVLALRYREPALNRPFKTPWVPFTPLFGIAVCAGLMYSLGAATWLRLILWGFLGVVIYFAYGRYHTKDSFEQTCCSIKLSNRE